MYKIAVLGDYDSIYGFATLGLDTFPVTTREEAGEMLQKFAVEEYAVVYVTEQMAAQLKNEIAEHQENQLPAIILIPGISGNTGAGIDGVKKSVEVAVGSDILFSQNT